MNKKKYINDTMKTLFQTLSNMGVTYEDEDLTFSIIENHITKVVEDLNIPDVSGSFSEWYNNGFKDGLAHRTIKCKCGKN